MEIEFKNGITEFENYKKFIVNDIENNKDFKSIVSVDDEYVGFIAVSPFTIINDYEFDINDEVIDLLEIEKAEDVMVLGLVRLGKTVKESTVNLKAPIIINIKNNKGMQYIIQNDKYLTREPIIRGDK